MKITNIFLLFITIVCSAQNKELIDKTHLKLKNDDKSFEQFVFYGFCNCTDKFFYSETFENNYTTTFNHLEPFPRLFEQNSIKTILDEYQNSQKIIFINIQKKYYNGYLITTKCHNLYNISNKNLRKIYNFFIANKDRQKEWSDDYMKDYLENYFIKIETE